MSNNVYGVDCGTMFFQVANAESIKIIRNAFVEISDIDDIESILKQNGWQYIQDGDKYYIIGEDSLRVSRMFPNVELRRPMADGVLNKNESKKMLVMAELINSTIGKAPDENSVVCTCVSSPPADGSIDSNFHKNRLSSMFTRNGWKVKIIEEGYAVVLSECPTITEEDGSESKYSGIGMSFGAGKVNCFLAYKAVPVIGMSVEKSGDYVDQKVSEELDIPISKVTAKKETDLDFNNIDPDSDIEFALDVYYNVIIKNALTKFGQKFSTVKSEFDRPMDLVLAGGTTMPKGFCDKVKKIISEIDLPFTIKSVRMAKDQRNAVVNGCLANAILTQKKLMAGKEDKEIIE